MQGVKLESNKVKFLVKQLEDERRLYESERIRFNDSLKELNQLMAKQRAEIEEESKGLIAQISERLKALESRAPDVRKNPYEPFSSNLFGAGIGTASGTQYGVDFSSHYTGTKPKIHKHRESKSVSFGVGGGSFSASKSDGDCSRFGTETGRSTNSHQKSNKSSNCENKSTDDSTDESSTLKKKQKISL